MLVFVFGRERLRTHSIESSGKLKISPEQHWDFTAEDLKDLGEIGRGAYGSVNKMVHKPSNQIMAVKVRHPPPKKNFFKISTYKSAQFPTLDALNNFLTVLPPNCGEVKVQAISYCSPSPFASQTFDE